MDYIFNMNLTCAMEGYEMEDYSFGYAMEGFSVKGIFNAIKGVISKIVGAIVEGVRKLIGLVRPKAKELSAQGIAYINALTGFAGQLVTEVRRYVTAVKGLTGAIASTIARAAAIDNNRTSLALSEQLEAQKTKREEDLKNMDKIDDYINSIARKVDSLIDRIQKDGYDTISRKSQKNNPSRRGEHLQETLDSVNRSSIELRDANKELTESIAECERTMNNANAGNTKPGENVQHCIKAVNTATNSCARGGSTATATMAKIQSAVASVIKKAGKYLPDAPKV